MLMSVSTLAISMSSPGRSGVSMRMHEEAESTGNTFTDVGRAYAAAAGRPMASLALDSCTPDEPARHRIKWTAPLFFMRETGKRPNEMP
jgi:hypothetical protein